MEMIWERLTWASPAMLILLVLLPWLFVRLHHRGPATDNALQFPSLNGIPPAVTWRVRCMKGLPYVRLLVFVLFVLALARPQWLLREEKLNAEGIAIFLVLDLSSSMLSQDFQPNRLEVSKAVAQEFVSKRPYDRIGLTAFSGEAFTQCPLTTDHDALAALLHELRCGMLEDGTAIGMGIASAVNRLRSDSARSKVIILITDGVNNAGDISPGVATELAKKLNVKIYAIGVGSNGEAWSPVGRSADGEYAFGMAPVNIDENLLRQVSRSTGGQYYRATNAEKLAEIYAEIDRLEKTRVEIRYIKRYAEGFRPLVWMALALLAAEWILRFTTLRTLC
ncbi:MAG: hypothetical protein JPMHGGIA_00637 [Saprospiraceae bacterium]|jgi:Ca-activated chloride channel family protein|nr:hypothetical protein [Saprospiraceae bacterium]